MSVHAVAPQPTTSSFFASNADVKRQLTFLLNTFKQIGQMFANLLLTPLHFVGSKFISLPEFVIRVAIYVKNALFCIKQGSFKDEVFKTGYELSPTRLPQERAAETIKQCRLFCATHTGNSDWLPANCTIIKRHQDKGMKVALIKEGDTTYVVYGALKATGNEHAKRDLCQGAANILGFEPPIYKKAERAFLRFKEQGLLDGQKVVFLGQCIGASLAQYVALKQGEEAVCLNSLGLGAWAQWDIGRDRLKKAKDTITQISVDRDIVSNPPCGMRALDFCVNLLGIRTIGNFGKWYSVADPKEFKGNRELIHNYIISALILHENPDAPTFKYQTKAEGRQYLKERFDRAI